MVGNYVKSIRKSKGLTQMQLAQKLGYNRQYLSKIEQNQVSPTFESLNNIASSLGLKMNPELFIE